MNVKITNQRYLRSKPIVQTIISWVAVAGFLLLSTLGVSAEKVEKDKSHAIDSIVAIVNDDVVTRIELEDEYQVLSRQLRAQGRQLPSEELLRKQILERMIVLRLQLQMAERGLIRINDEQLNNTMERMAQQNGLSLGRFRLAVQAEGIDYAKYRERIRDEMTINRLQQRQVVNQIIITDKEVEDFIANEDLRKSGDIEFQLLHILVSVPEAASPQQIQEAKAKAKAILKEVTSGAEFSQVAMARSDGQQALEGGNLGWRKLVQLPTLFSEVVPSMKVGEVSQLIRSPSGFHIVKLNDKRKSEKKYIVEESKVRHILVALNDFTSDEQARLRIEDLKKRIENGEPFEKIAEKSDDKASAADGGNLGWVREGKMVKPFERAMLALSIGELSDPVRTPFGWHLIQVMERRKVDDTKEFEKNRARQILHERKLEPALANWLRRIRDESYVEVRL